MHQRRQRLPSCRVLQQRKVSIVASVDDCDHCVDGDDGDDDNRHDGDDDDDDNHCYHE